MGNSFRRILVIGHSISVLVSLEVGMRPNKLVASPIEQDLAPTVRKINSNHVFWNRIGENLYRTTKTSLLMYGWTL